MSGKNIAIAACWVTAIVLFALVGFEIVSTTKFDLVALGLGLTVLGFLIDKFVAPAAA
jgi:hypothetical protein